MKRHKKIALLIGMTEGDSEAVKWASLVSDLSSTEEVHILHCLPEKKWLKTRYTSPFDLNREESNALQYMMNLVDDHWEGLCGANVEFNIGISDSPLHYTLNEINDIEADLVVMSRESIGNEMAVKLVRKSTCSVLMIPEGCVPNISQILIPTDFSRLSKYAYDVGSAFARSLGISTIESIHGYDIGSRPSHVTIPIPQQKELSRAYAEREHADFLSSLPDFGVAINQKEEFSNYIPGLVQERAELTGADLIVLSCRGSNSMMGWLLGTIPENLLKDSDLPVLAVKTKNTGASLLRELLGKSPEEKTAREEDYKFT